MLLIKNPQRLPCDVPFIWRPNLASVNRFGASVHSVLPWPDDVESDAANMDLPRWLYLNLLPDLVQAYDARPSVAPRLLVVSVCIESL